MSDFYTDFNELMRRVETGEIGSSNLAEMVLVEREKNAVLVLALKEQQVLYNEIRSAFVTALPRVEEQSLNDAIELILWLALPWADNDPLFPEDDGWTPRALEANARMKATWQRVVRNQSPGAVPEENKGGANGSE
jgi:hypothetical protein